MRIWKDLLLLSLLPGAMLILLGLRCSFKGGPTQPIPSHAYQLNGVAVRDMNSNVEQVFVSFKRDTLAFDSALIKFDNVVLTSLGQGYYRAQTPAISLKANISYTISVSYPKDNLDFSMPVIVPDTFSIDSSSLDALERLYRGGKNSAISIEWSPSLNAEGYMVAAIPQDPNAPNYYSAAILGDAVLGATIPPTGFYDPNADTLVTGLYLLYAASYRETFSDYPDLPFPLPAGLSDNIALQKMKGRFGASTIARYDTIRVTTQFAQ